MPLEVGRSDWYPVVLSRMRAGAARESSDIQFERGVRAAVEANRLYCGIDFHGAGAGGVHSARRDHHSRRGAWRKIS